MPTPREAYQNTVERQGFSGARVQAADYGASGEIIGRAAQGFGQDLQRVGSDLDEIHTIYATAAAKDADTQAALRLQSLRNGYKQLEQSDALTAKPKVLGDIDALEAEMSGQLKDARARTIFKEVFSRRKLAAVGDIDEHEIVETKKYGEAKSLARETASKIVAIDAPTEDEMFVNIETAINEKWSRMSGAAKEDKALEAYQLRSEVLAKRAQAITDPIKQEQFRQQYSKMISPEHEAVLIRSNQAGLTDAQSAFRSTNFADWRAGGRDSKLIQTPGSQVTHVDDAGVELPSSGLVPIDVPPSTVAGKPAAAPRAATAVVQGAHYDPTRGIGTVTATAAQHHARNGGTGRVAIDTAAPVGTAIYPPVQGKVIEAPREQRGQNGYMVRVDYGDGLVGTYIHMKSPSPLKEGDVVDTSAVVGLVGNTGHSTGAHVDYSVTKNGAVVNPNNVTYRGHGGEGMTSTLDQYRADDADTTQLVSDVRAYAKQAGMSQVEERTLLRDQMEVVNFNRGLQQDKERQADRAIDEWLIGIGDRNFKLGEVPGLSGASPAQQKYIIGTQEQRSKPKEPPAGGQDYVDAMVTAENDPATFSEMRLGDMSLTNEERTRLQIKQGTLKTADGKPKESAIDDDSTITQRMNTYLRRESLVTGNVDKVNEINMREALRARVVQRIAQRESETGKKLGFNEIDAIVQEQVTKVTYTDPTGKQTSGRLFQVPGFAPGEDKIGINPRDRARNALRRANQGIPPTEGQIDKFLREHGG